MRYAVGAIFCASKTVSRVLYLTVIYLDALLPTRSSHPGSGRASLCAPIPVLLRIEFTATDASTPSGALLPHLSILAPPARSASSPAMPPTLHPGAFPEGRAGRYISVALFLKSPSAGVTRYPCPVEPGLSSWRSLSPPPRGRLSYSPCYSTKVPASCQQPLLLFRFSAIILCW